MLHLQSIHSLYCILSACCLCGWKLLLLSTGFSSFLPKPPPASYNSTKRSFITPLLQLYTCAFGRLQLQSLNAKEKLFHIRYRHRNYTSCKCTGHHLMCLTVQSSRVKQSLWGWKRRTPHFAEWKHLDSSHLILTLITSYSGQRLAAGVNWTTRCLRSSMSSVCVRLLAWKCLSACEWYCISPCM